MHILVLYDDSRSGCVSIDDFSNVARNGGNGAWPAWSIPPLYAYGLKTNPPGTASSPLKGQPTSHPNDDEEISVEEVNLQKILINYYDPLENSVCYLDFFVTIYSHCMDKAQVPTFLNVCEVVGDFANRGVESDTARSIVDYMKNVRLIEPHAR